MLLARRFYDLNDRCRIEKNMHGNVKHSAHRDKLIFFLDSQSQTISSRFGSLNEQLTKNLFFLRERYSFLYKNRVR